MVKFSSQWNDQKVVWIFFQLVARLSQLKDGENENGGEGEKKGGRGGGSSALPFSESGTESRQRREMASLLFAGFF